MKLSVLMPVYNEINTLAEVVRRVRAVDIPKEIILIDDGSTDGSRDILAGLEKEPEDPQNAIKVVFKSTNQGKGAAIRTGIDHVTGDVVVIQDADLEYDPQDYGKLLGPIESEEADVVYGSRFIGVGPRRVLFFWHCVGNQILTLFSNSLTNLNLSDMEVGYKALRTEVIKQLDIKSHRFGIEPEITVKIAKRGYRIYEVPISYRARNYKEGKKITWKDGIAAFYTLLRFRLMD